MSIFKKIRIIFYCRMVLWLIAAASTIYWIWWSFHLYAIGIHDEHTYATMLRPVFGKYLFISVAAICISFILRAISDRIKKQITK